MLTLEQIEKLQEKVRSGAFLFGPGELDALLVAAKSWTLITESRWTPKQGSAVRELCAIIAALEAESSRLTALVREAELIFECVADEHHPHCPLADDDDAIECTCNRGRAKSWLNAARSVCAENAHPAKAELEGK